MKGISDAKLRTEGNVLLKLFTLTHETTRFMLWETTSAVDMTGY